MTKADWLGLVAGLLFGALLGWSHAISLRRRAPAAYVRPLVETALRVVALLAFLLLANHFGANKYWLVGGLVVAYTVPFLWELKHAAIGNKKA